jgi:hypothetical protein
MNVNKKLDRFKQWAGERMGGEARTNVSDDFKAMETEMNLRHDGESPAFTNQRYNQGVIMVLTVN